MDISGTLAAKSAQLNAADLPRPRIFRILAVTDGPSHEQPVDVRLDGWPTPWRPCKSMRRVLAAAWGAESGVWVGRSVELYCDAEVLWAGERAGGIRIAALSDIPPAGIEVVLRASKTKAAPRLFRRLDVADPLEILAAERGEDLATTEAAIAAASGRPCPADHQNRQRAAVWARSDRGRDALRAAAQPQHGD